MKQFFLSGALSLLGVSRALVPVALAADENPPGGTPKQIVLVDPLQGQTFQGIVVKLAKQLELLAIPIVGIMVLYGAFQIMTAAGNPTKVSDGRKTILYAVIGYAIVLLGAEVVPIIQELLSN